MIIKKISIEKFRDIRDTEFKLGKYITAISGRNGSMKSTLLGIISQNFTIPLTGHPLSGMQTIDGYDFKSQFSEKFRFSANEIAKDHRWTTYFYNQIYKEDTFTCESMYRDKTSKKLRFWNAKGRGAGTGYPNIPVYFLSLSRLSPIGEVKKFKKDVPELSDEENDFFVKNHKDILCNTYSTNDKVGMRNTTKKLFSGLNTDTYDVNSNSAGEDNVGKIILSILSFKRIKKKYPNDYHGGILLIDELDAAIFPYSQKKLVNFLYKQARESKLQIVFTTHSPYILKAVMSIPEYDNKQHAESSHIPSNRALLYMRRQFNGEDKSFYINIQEIHKKIELHKCLDDIKLEPFSPTTVNIYFEDKRSRNFFKYLLGDKYSNYLNLIDIDLGWTNYFQLHEHNIPEFKTNSILILDHDVISKLHEDAHRHQFEYFSNSDNDVSNILFLPIDIEKGFYKMLKARENYSIFEKITGLQYDVCFRDYIVEDENEKMFYKNWYSAVLKMINCNEQAFYVTWKTLYQEEYLKFINSFKKAYNARAKELDLDEIED